jgi:hypothetical protein
MERALLALLLLGCSPEVLLASHEQAGGMPGVAGTASAGSGGSGGSTDSGGEPGDDAGAAGEPGLTPEPPRILGDSVADFALVQGEHDWYYGYDNGSFDSFKLMTRISVITTFKPESGDVWDCWANDTTHWTQLFRLGGHANGTDTSPPSVAVLERAVRRWISTYAGEVVISGELAKIDVTETMISTGIQGAVVVDGTELYSKVITGQDGAGTSYEVTTTLAVGSTVDFVLDPYESSDHNDLTRFTGIIARPVVLRGP